MTIDVVRLDAADGDEVVAGQSRPLGLVEGGKPPTEYLMFAPGVNETVKGPLLFDDEAAKSVLDFYESRGRKRIAGDWEHDSLRPPNERSAYGTPASHWFEPDVRQTDAGPELWAANIQWTPTAFEQLSRGEYAHTSPVVKFDKKTGRILAVLSSALTNDPATIGQPQLVAASARALTPETPPPSAAPERNMWKMDGAMSAKLKALADAEHESPEMAAKSLKACLSEGMPDHFKELSAAPPVDSGATPEPGAKSLADENEAMKAKLAEDAEEKKELRALSAEIKALTGKSARVEQVAVVEAWKVNASEVAALTAAGTDPNKAAFDAVLAKGRADKKLTPADLTDGSRTAIGQYVAAQRTKGADGVVALKAFLETVGPRVTTSETAVTEKKTETTAVLALTDEEKITASRMGISHERMLASKREQLANGYHPVAR
jgi:phage I-like protein